MAATGNFNQVFLFLEGLESGEIPTLAVEEIHVTAGEPGKKNFLGVIPVEASLSLAVYAMPPAREQP